jgi:hypothetical protein
VYVIDSNFELWEYAALVLVDVCTMKHLPLAELAANKGKNLGVGVGISFNLALHTSIVKHVGS